MAAELCSVYFRAIWWGYLAKEGVLLKEAFDALSRRYVQIHICFAWLFNGSLEVLKRFLFNHIDVKY